MKLSSLNFEIGLDDGFKGDCFRREGFGQRVTNIVKNVDGSLVIALDSPWGAGKSTFVKMWQGQLKQNGVSSVYVDAFKTDYFEDPFLAIAGVINEFVESSTLEDSGKKQEFLDRAKKVGMGLLGFGLKVGVKAATLGVLDKEVFDSLDGVASDVADGASEVAEEIIKNKLKSYSQEMGCIEKFKKVLSDMPSNILGNDSGKLVIIVDELDRCRPNYAVEFLERIKHFFAVDGVVFLLVVNKDQLMASMRYVYGVELNANEYLQRFIDLNLMLPRIKWQSDYDNDYFPYVEKLSEAYRLGWNRDQLKTLAMYLAGFEISLRNMERILAVLVVLKSQVSSSIFNFEDYSVLFSLIRVEYPDLFKLLDSGDASYNAVFDALKFEERKVFSDADVSFIKNAIRYLLIDEHEYRQSIDDFIPYSREFGRLSRSGVKREYLDAIALVK